MNAPNRFIGILTDNFPDDRLTYQKGIPTFHPEDIDEAAKCIGLAKSVGQKLYVTGFGNNIDPLGEAFNGLIVLRTDRLGQMIAVNESDLSVVVGAGFPLREINAKIEPVGLFLPIGNLPYVGSVGGAIAIGLSAELPEEHWQSKPRHGSEEPTPPQISIEKYILRLDVATAVGEAKTFGVATDKQSHGENYAKIFSPSWGLFGFIASAKFRVAPLSAKPEYENLRGTELSYQRFLKEHLTTDGENQERRQSPRQRYFSQLKNKLDPDNVLPVINTH